MSTHGPDDRVEEILRGALRAEAGAARPAGDGLARIQQRVAARQRRLQWARPTALVVGSAAAVAVIGVGGFLVADNVGGGGKTAPVTSQTATPQPGHTGFPKRAIFPFTTPAAERTWQRAYVAGGHMPWVTSPAAVATSWVQNILQQPTVARIITTTVHAATADVALGRKLPPGALGPTRPVTVVHLVKSGKAWIVTGASDGTSQLSIVSPSPGAVVSTSAASPLTVTGPGYGPDESADIQVRDATTPALYGHASTGTFGSGTAQWTANVSYRQPTSAVGALVAVEASAADGGPAGITAQQIRFTALGPTPGSTSSFYGVEHNRIAKIDATTGAVQGYLTTAPAGRITDVHLVGDSVYFLDVRHGCAATIQQVATTGGSSGYVTAADRGYTIGGFAVSPDMNKVAYFATGCGSARPQGKLVVLDRLTHRTRAIRFDAEPPAIEGDPAWESDNVHLDAFVRTGMEGYLARYDTVHDTSPAPTDNACRGLDPNQGLPGAIDVDGSGTLWFAVQTGRSMQVLRCISGTPQVAFSTPGNDAPTHLDVRADGSGVLLVGSVGSVGSVGTVWRWDGSGAPHRVAARTPAGATW